MRENIRKSSEDIFQNITDEVGIATQVEWDLIANKIQD